MFSQSFPDISCYSGRVPVDSRGRGAGSEKAFRDNVRDALSGLARGNCHRAVLMGVDFRKEALTQAVPLQEMAEVEDGGLIRQGAC